MISKEQRSNQRSFAESNKASVRTVWLLIWRGATKIEDTQRAAQKEQVRYNVKSFKYKTEFHKGDQMSSFVMDCTAFEPAILKLDLFWSSHIATGP